MPVDRTAFHAQYTLEGLGSLPIDASTVLELQLGDFTFQATVGEADVATSNRWVFHLTTSWVDPTGRTHTRRTGKIVFARRGNLLTVLAWDGRIGNVVLVPPYMDHLPGQPGPEPPGGILFGMGGIGRPIVWLQHWEDGRGRFSGEVPLAITVGGLTLNRTLSYQGSAAVHWSNRSQLSLRTMLARGRDDMTRPGSR